MLAIMQVSGHTKQVSECEADPVMFQAQNPLDKTDSILATAPGSAPAGEAKQHRLMAVALALLIVALAVVLYRDFSPGTVEDADYDPPADTTPLSSAPAPATTVAPAVSTSAAPRSTRVAGKKIAAKTSPNPATAAKPEAPPMAVQAQRTVLPPLEVEVVAGDNHRTVRPGSNSVRLDLQPGVPPQTTAEPATEPGSDTAASSTRDAAEKVEMSSGEQLVTRTVRPNYPMLARQAKVQGSVVLQVLIGRDGVIQNLHVVSGPPILATAAQDAVRQWRFKPHMVGSETVETQAKITVNFTISTN